MPGAHCLGEPRTGRALAALRVRFVVWDHVDRLVHRIMRTRHVDVLGAWPCWNYDSVSLERAAHDHAYAAAHLTPVDVI